LAEEEEVSAALVEEETRCRDGSRRRGELQTPACQSFLVE